MAIGDEAGASIDGEPHAMIRRRDWLAYQMLGLSIAYTGCDFVESSDSQAALPMPRRRGTQPISIVATVGMVADMVRQLGGDQVVVEQIMGAGVDPHLYKGTRDDVRLILAGELVFYSGLMLEGKLAHMLEKVARRKPVIAITQTLKPSQLLTEADSIHHADPHVWMDVAAWSDCSRTITQTLCQFDPDHQPQYEAASEAYRRQLQSLHDYAKQVMSTIPQRGRVLITSHDAFHYFGRAYQIEVFGVQGLSTDSEAGLTQINALVSMIVEREIKAVFVESSVPQKSLRAVVDGAASRGHKIVIGGELFSDAMGRWELTKELMLV